MHRLRSIPLVLSTFLLLSTLILYVRSYWVADAVVWTAGNGFGTVVCDSGGMIVGRARVIPDVPGATFDVEEGFTHQPPSGYLSTMRSLSPRPAQVLGFALAHNARIGGSLFRIGISVVALPLWFPALLFSILPTHWLLLGRHRRLRARRQHLGLCPTCGYDLRVQLALSEEREPNGRASPTRCPECGHQAP